MSTVNTVHDGHDSSGMEPPASIGRRVLAYVVDVAIAAVVSGVSITGALLVWMPLFGDLLEGKTPRGDGLGDVSVLGLVLVFVGALLSLAWGIVWLLMQGGRGSVGMRLLKIRLIRRGFGTKIGFWRALGRQIVFGVLASVIVGYLTPLFDRSGRRQGWHDLVVGAIMVDEPAFTAGLARAAALAAAPPPAPEPVPLEELDRDRAFGLPVAPPAVPPLPGARGVGAGVAPVGSALPPAPLIVDLPAHLGAREATTPAAAPQLEMRWDDGAVVTVAHGAVIGRDPVASIDAARVSPKMIGAVSMPVADRSMSLSKTHFGAGIDRTGAWIVDLHSTNGTILHREGIVARPLVPGELTALRSGDSAVIGTRRVTFMVSDA